MIPRRIKLKGFMSFRHEAELLFDGSGLWALTGPNGAGKSAIFDAIVFALYGVHRTSDIDLKGTQDTKALINHHEPGLEVEFEFALGDEIFSVKRTLQKKKRGSTFQVFRYTGNNGSGKAKSKWVSVRDTHLKAGVDTWVTENIGLDPKAFMAAVLLGQGKSDALLCHKPEARHKILSQIIDISAYERLHLKAKDKHDKSKSDAESYQRQLTDIPAVDDDQFTEVTTRAAEFNTLVEVALSQLGEIIALKKDAERWNELIKEQSEIEQELKNGQGLLALEEKIKADAARLKELERLLPQVKRLLDERQRLATSDSKIINYTSDAERWIKKADRLDEESGQAQKQYDELQQRQDTLQQQKSVALQTISELSLQIHELNDIDELRPKVEEYDKALTNYPPDLNEQVARLSDEVKGLEELKQVVSTLERYCEARAEWRGARKRGDQANTDAARLSEEHSAVSKQHKELEGTKEEIDTLLEDAKQRATEARTRVAHVEEKLSRFSIVDGQPTCDYCGQVLTAKHLNSERSRIEAELDIAKKAKQETEQKVEEITANRRSNTQTLKKLAEQLTGVKEEERLAGESLRDALKDQQRAERQGRGAVKELPSSYLNLILPSASDDITNFFIADYPSTEELSALGERAALYEANRQKLDGLQEAVASRDIILARREPAIERLSELSMRYPASDAATIRSNYQEAVRVRDQSSELLKQLQRPLREAEQTLNGLKEAAGNARDEWQRTSAKINEEQVRREELVRGVGEKQSELIREGLTNVPSLTEEQLNLWQEESLLLAGADAELIRLEEARRNKERHELRLDQIQRDIVRIPENARCPLEVMDKHESELRRKHTEAEKERGEAEQLKQALGDRRERRHDLEGKHLDASHKEQLYRELTRLLGRDYLQRHLLQQAEMGIVKNANEVLDRVSSGTLRLELTPSAESDDGNVTTRSSNKALDLFALHSETGGAPMPVDFLSGSQRFRVAVSLALGIGRYASQGTRRIESVIIDEGFGSLDKTGRREMIDELHLLKDELKRIILVSHQEEIADAFSNKYKVELIDGSSRVSLVT